MAKNKNTEVPINGLYDDEGKLFGEAEESAEEAVTEEVEIEEEAEVSLSQEELEALCRESVCPECDVHKEAEAIRLRALADAENVKKRLLRETEEMKKYAGESILADLLPILDNLDLALAHTDGLDAACNNFVIGVDMTRKLFLDAVKNHGLVVVEAARGMEFNPEIHEAVGTAEEGDLDDNQITQVVQGGYTLKGRLLRPAKVMVNKA
ncbi:nucleotide exchange factor GrpE [Pseudodesulfovibrio sp. zrk46]|uniref:nucleotide exchange factor GrpE n=1 Tax=Pseudodesulfovibrio sp. zrk46 TaxID=2725288 RepID=UPI001449F108|nr:nucleotide exchange factor GrpE [Pseudodesulfovibrio sp. zrk46]QJB57322.1 nucleotide exchange factor GrpE [Pseudodesulfovibrio sp. zrk46]